MIGLEVFHPRACQLDIMYRMETGAENKVNLMYLDLASELSRIVDFCKQELAKEKLR